MIQRIPLNNHWLFKPSFEENDLINIEDINSFESIRIPHTNKELPYHYFDENSYQFVSSYKIKLPHLEFDTDEEISVYFEGVMAYTEIYLNGTFLGEHFGGYTPFEINLPKGLLHLQAAGHVGQDNWLFLKVDSRERDDIPPFGYVVDYLTYGGIYREVQLQVQHKKRLRNIKVETPLLEQNFNLDVYFDVTQSTVPTDEVTIELYDQKQCLSKYTVSELKLVDNQVHLGVQKQITKWSLETPKLYELKITLSSKQVPTYSFTTKVGFRTAVFENDGFYLNGNKIKLRGLNRHQSYPYVGYAMPQGAQYADADMLKFELGVNVVRSSHYPPSRHFLNRCDEIGLLVVEELPGWQHIGDTAWQKLAVDSLEEMIRRDWNHPSVILWGTRINESKDNHQFYSSTSSLAKKLDATRATGGVRNFAGSEILEDVYTYNDFLHRGNNQALDQPQKIAKRKMPYLVTEHNGHMFPTKSFDSEAKKIEHALRHARVLNAAYSTTGISGAIGWCMFDYNTHKDFGSGDKICYHGVLDMFRNPKYAAGVYASQQSKTPYLTVASNFSIGDYDASELGKIVVLTNCDSVKVYRNDIYINTFYPDKDEFSALPHPPIIVDDLIGNLLYENERFSEKDAKTIKRILLHFLKYGGQLPIIDKLQMGMLFVKYKMSFADAADLYGKYIAGWGEKSKTYRFDGIIDEEVVTKVIKSSSDVFELKITADKTELYEDETYDVTRISLAFVDQHGSTLSYANHIATCNIKGPLELIGPSTFPLIAGSRAFWVKTTGSSGVAQIEVALDNGLKANLDLIVN